MQKHPLLTRDRFRESVLARDNHACVVCKRKGIPLDAHHIIERRLFPDGGYYLANGASLCDPECHTRAEQTLVSCDELRDLCGIRDVILPPHLYDDTRYDKWGNVILPNGRRLRGELFFDESVHAVLAPVLDLFDARTKPPRTWHLPWSPGATEDDRVMPDVEFFRGREVVVTAKMDGENTTIYGPDGYVHARRVEPLATPDSGRIKALALEIGVDIPAEWRVCGENIVRQHTIHYENLTPHDRWFFPVFNVWNARNECLAWDEVCEWAALLNLPTVPVLWRGVWDEAAVKASWQPTFNGDPCEGYVVRPAQGFSFRDYRRAVGKFVRAKFQQKQTHRWRYDVPVFNAPRKA